jgi:hypothetical protein
MDRRRPLLEISIVLGLIALVGALATLQYRWLGQVSDAERARLHVSLEQRANEFATDLDREITRTYMRFQNAGMLLTQGDANGFATQFDEWSRSPQAPLVRDVFRLTKDHALEQYRRADRRFVPVAWPPELQPLRSDTLPRPAESFLSALPAMVVPLPAVQPPPASDVFFTFHFEPESLVLWFDREYLTQAFLPALADRHFSAGGTDVRLAIVDAREPSRTLFTRGVPTGSSITPDRADVAVDIAIRPELADPPTGGPDAGARMARTNIYLERRTNPGSKTIVAVRSLTAGRWRLLVQPAAGSLDTLVAGQRRRNLMLSFGMLVLLAVSVGILLTIARRSQRLATQQMEFVATIPTSFARRWRSSDPPRRTCPRA